MVALATKFLDAYVKTMRSYAGVLVRADTLKHFFFFFFEPDLA